MEFRNEWMCECVLIGNNIGAEGCRMISEVLIINSTLTILGLMVMKKKRMKNEEKRLRNEGWNNDNENEYIKEINR